MKLKVDQINYKLPLKDILHDISFSIEDGEIIALLGDNGAGKTTLFEIITDIKKQNSGRIIFDNGKSFSKIKKEAGILLDNLTLFPWLKVKEVIDYVSNIYKIKEIPNLIYDSIGLKEIENSLMNSLSKGEKKRVAILLCTLHSPTFLLLDEPTAELDPLRRKLIWENIFLDREKTILFSTHIWEEALQYASKIIFISKGKLVNQPCSSVELLNSIQIEKKIVIHDNIQIKGMNSFSYNNKSNTTYLLKKEDNISLDQINKQTSNFSILPVTLEDVYYYLTQNINQ
ncbi:ATP-binding cassette domain-containing protein [Marinilabilia salmonicolor]|uniref:ABC-2 type transport system ATP-binding protein n=1 Tax=Marinilabilia salmonicolor TaxID=989 RepID=A0A368UJ43_9BACT|nr:ABC transporter ATP-binding protein [Marinilabilia salmonicolor]RCW26109.1 ABC-2 type transport system ATP-binding protein [Marinilabilia salmonicolor]